MASTFDLLTAGARFDKSRFQQDFELFEKKEKKSKGKGKAKEPAKTLPSSLNFFGDRSAAPKQPEPESESDESDAESSSSASIPEPPKQKITLTGPEPLPSSLSTDLSSLFDADPESPLRKPLLRALKDSNIHSLWGVQCAVGGSLMAGKDTMCIAPTGSGKTLSYLLPTLVALRQPARKLQETGGGKGIRALVVVPTHDLAVQIHGVLKAITAGQKWRCIVLSKATQKAVCDSAPGATEAAEDEDDEVSDEGDTTGLGIDVLVATPERLHHLLEEGRVSLSETRHLILDESDRLLGPDFLPQVEPIVDACTSDERQTCLLSATMPAGVESLARKWLDDGGVRVVVGVKDSAVTTVDQSLLFTGSESGKTLALRNLIAEGGLPYPSLIFVQSIERADELSKQLVLDGVRAEAVHSNRGKSKRDAAIEAFRNGSVWVLVVTEVLARGMDFRGVKVVVNYDFPQTVQSYIHRIGRTGRAGRPGKAITFFSKEDGPYLRTIANVLQASGCTVPEYMLSMRKPSKNLKRKLAKAPVQRKAVGGGGRDVAQENAKRKRQMIEGSKRRKQAQSKGESKGEADGQASD